MHLVVCILVHSTAHVLHGHAIVFAGSLQLRICLRRDRYNNGPLTTPSTYINLIAVPGQQRYDYDGQGERQGA
jgi:hypothetical protein